MKNRGVNNLNNKTLESAIFTSSLFLGKATTVRLLLMKYLYKLNNLILKILVNPYFIFRFISCILAVFIGIDLFNESTTFTDENGEKEFNNEKKLDKGKEIATNNETETQTEQSRPAKGSKWFNLSMLKAYDDMKVQTDYILGEARKAGDEEIANGAIKDLTNDAKAIASITKHLGEMSVNEENLSTENNKRFLDEDLSENENENENKKLKSQDKSWDINKQSRDNGEGPSGTK
jgi:hypothetical protein